VELNLNASLRYFAPSSLILLSACHSEHGQRLTSLLISNIQSRTSCWSVELNFNASPSSFEPSTPISFTAYHSEHGQRLTSPIISNVQPRFSSWRAEFTFNASLSSFEPSTSISFPACHSEHGQPCIIWLTTLLIRRYVQLRFSCWSVEFTFNASLKCFAPSSPILFSACHREYCQRLTSLLIVDTDFSGTVAGAWSSLSMLRSGVLLRQLQSYSLHATVNMVRVNIAIHS
jgi:hypothetical protein